MIKVKKNRCCGLTTFLCVSHIILLVLSEHGYNDSGT